MFKIHRVYHQYIPIIHLLVGGIPTPLKNMSSSVGIIIPSIWKIIKFRFKTTNQFKDDIMISEFYPHSISLISPV